MDRTRTIHSALFVAILAVAGFLLFWKLGTTSFHNGDEARYAQSAREMLESGDYLTITYKSEPYLVKPPGKVWMALAGFRLFGVNELGARFTSALFALGTIILTFVLGRALFGTTAGLLAAAILASSSQFIHEHCGRTAECEPETAFLYVLSMLCVWHMQRDRRWIYGLAVSLGLVTMMKGPVVIPAVIVAGLYLALSGDRAAWRWRTVAGSILVFLAIVLPWNLHQWFAVGDLYRERYLGIEIWGRFTGDVDPELGPVVPGIDVGRGVLYYPSVVFYSLFPWSLLAVPALSHLLAGIKRKGANPRLLLVLWIFIFALVITLAEAKLHWYVIPIVPAVAIGVARFCVFLEGSRSRVLFYTVVIAALLCSWLFLPAPDYDPHSRLSVHWPHNQTNIAAFWGLEKIPLASTVPLLFSAALALVMFLTMLFRRRTVQGDSRIHRRLWVLFLGSFLFAGFYQAVLPLRMAGHRHEIARCLDTARAKGLRPERVVLAGRAIVRNGMDRHNYFYISGLAGGMRGEVVTQALLSPRTIAPLLEQSRTVVLADWNVGHQVSWYPGMRLIRDGDKVDLYCTGDTAKGARRERGGGKR